MKLKIILVMLLGLLIYGCDNSDGLLYDDYSSVMECYIAETGFQGLPPNSERSAGERKIAQVVMDSCKDLF